MSVLCISYNMPKRYVAGYAPSGLVSINRNIPLGMLIDL